MALVTVEGVYEDGKVELNEKPEGVEKARVMVTFLPTVQEVAGTTVATAHEVARQRAFARMKAGLDFGGLKFRREELYEERMQHLDEHRSKG